MILLWIPAAILALFILFSIIRGPAHKRFGFKICSICAAVAMTWIVLLVLRSMGRDIDPLMIGILMGESLVGVMYLFEKVAVKRGKHILWLKAVIIVLGTGLVYALLSQGISTISVLLLIVSVAFAIGLYILLQKNEHVSFKAHGKLRDEIKKLEDVFEHCCD